MKRLVAALSFSLFAFSAPAVAQDLRKAERHAHDGPYHVEETRYFYGHTPAEIPFVVYRADSKQFEFPAVKVEPLAKEGHYKLTFTATYDEPFYTTDSPFATIEQAEAVIDADQIVALEKDEPCGAEVTFEKVGPFYAWYFASPLMIEMTPGFYVVGDDGQTIGGAPATQHYVYEDDKPFLIYDPAKPDKPMTSPVYVNDGKLVFRYRNEKRFDVFPGPVPQAQWDQELAGK